MQLAVSPRVSLPVVSQSAVIRELSFKAHSSKWQESLADFKWIWDVYLRSFGDIWKYLLSISLEQDSALGTEGYKKESETENQQETKLWQVINLIYNVELIIIWWWYTNLYLWPGHSYSSSPLYPNAYSKFALRCFTGAPESTWPMLN